MDFLRKAGKMKQVLALVLCGAGLLVSGCGMPGAPMPPSLNLPQPVADLRAVRSGNEVALSWTMPRRNTDKLLLKNAVAAKVCREETKKSVCTLVGELRLEPGAPGKFTEKLSANLTSGKPRALGYFLEIENAHGRSAGPSNVVWVVAGQAPPSVTGLKAEVRKNGVLLRWTPQPGENDPVRLVRKRLTGPTAKAKLDPLAPEDEPLEQNLRVSAQVGQGRAFDKAPRFGQSYEYRAQRIARVQVNGETLELHSALSSPIRVDVKDIFPPDAPQGVAAVAAAPGSGAAIDLNWQPNSEEDLAGYIVYRREGEGEWQRVSPAAPLSAPAYRDATVTPGHTYRYAVSAVDQGGHASQHSDEAEETVPAE